MVNKFLGYASLGLHAVVRLILQLWLVVNKQMVVILSADWQSC